MSTPEHLVALDTNVLARYLLADGVRQTAAATRLLATEGPFLVSQTVWLELVWVLQSNDCTREEVVLGVRHLLGLPGLRSADADQTLQALAWYAAGIDFGDALHLATAAHATELRTFDKAFVRRAGQVRTQPVVHPLA